MQTREWQPRPRRKIRLTKENVEAQPQTNSIPLLRSVPNVTPPAPRRMTWTKRWTAIDRRETNVGQIDNLPLRVPYVYDMRWT